MPACVYVCFLRTHEHTHFVCVMYLWLHVHTRLPRVCVCLVFVMYTLASLLCLSFCECTITSPGNAPPGNVANGQIEYLFGIPLERVWMFPGEDVASSDVYLLPDWMRDDLNAVAVELYLKFMNEYLDDSKLDVRNAESVISAFTEFQHLMITNETELVEFLNPNEELKKSIGSFFGFKRLLGKLGTDFANKMGFGGGTKFLYTARLHAEVFGPGDATNPSSYASEGGVAAGVIFTHLPTSTIGASYFEIMDPRGHNPPFGKDENIKIQVGLGLMFPSWLQTFTPPHRHAQPANKPPLLTHKDIYDTHRIDWIFEIGLFQYSRAVRSGFVDYEHCPFQDASKVPSGQILFKLNVEELVALKMTPTEISE